MVRLSNITPKWYCVETPGIVLCFGAFIVPHKLAQKCNGIHTDIMKQYYQTEHLHKHTGNQILGF
jgi:hypothetical protein